MLRLFILAAALSVSACADKYQLPVCHGPLMVLNSDEFHPTAAEVKAAQNACPDEGAD